MYTGDKNQKCFQIFKAVSFASEIDSYFFDENSSKFLKERINTEIKK